jgi:hypothetical protein
MNIPLDIKLLVPKQEASLTCLSVGYGNAHIVIEVTGADSLERLLAFLFEHREERGAHWIEFGRFGPFVVTVTLGDDWLALVIDSGLTVDGFGQSSGLYIPRELLDSFIDAVAREHRKYVEKPAA